MKKNLGDGKNHLQDVQCMSFLSNIYCWLKKNIYNISTVTLITKQIASAQKKKSDATKHSSEQRRLENKSKRLAHVVGSATEWDG